MLELSSYMSIVVTTNAFSFALQCDILQCIAKKGNLLQVCRVDPIYCDIFGPAEQLYKYTYELISSITIHVYFLLIKLDP